MKGSWIVSARRTYYDLIANRIVGTTLPSFSDLQAKASWELRPGQRLSLFVLGSREKTDAEFDEDSSASTFGLGDKASQQPRVPDARLDVGRPRLVAHHRVLVRLRRQSDRERNIEDENKRSNAPGDEAFGRADVAFARDLGVRDLSLREEWRLRRRAKHVVETGGEVHVLDTR